MMQALSQENNSVFQSVCGHDADPCNWNQMVKLLADYVKDNSDGCVPTQHVTPDGVRLGRWVSMQRTNLKKGTLSEQQLEDLIACGFEFNSHEAAFDRFIEHFVDFKTTLGHPFVPQTYITEGGIKLGSWTHDQRRMYSRNELSNSRIDKLIVAGFEFDVHQQSWLEFYDALKVFKKGHGHLRIPKKISCVSGKRLGIWVEKQRALEGQGNLREDRKNLLIGLGFQFNVFDENWDRKFEYLKTYK